MAALTETVRVDVRGIARDELRAIAAEFGILDEHDQLEALIPCMRQSAQSTLAALHRAGLRIVKEYRP